MGTKNAKSGAYSLGTGDLMGGAAHASTGYVYDYLFPQPGQPAPTPTPDYSSLLGGLQGAMDSYAAGMAGMMEMMMANMAQQQAALQTRISTNTPSPAIEDLLTPAPEPPEEEEPPTPPEEIAANTRPAPSLLDEEEDEDDPLLA